MIPVEDLKRDLAKLDGKSPYDGPENPSRGDSYFANDIERRYGKSISELRKLINQ